MANYSSFFDDYAIVFAGGGSRGSWQLGVWKAFEKHGIPRPRAIAGTSVGALNAAMFSQGDYEKAQEVWLNTDTLKVLDGQKEHSWLMRQLASVLDSGSKMGWRVLKGALTLPIQLGGAVVNLLNSDKRKDGFSVFAADGLCSLIDEGVTWEDGAFKIPTFICVHNKNSQRVEYYSLQDTRLSMEERKLLLRASASIPKVFPHVKVRDNCYCDGGVAYRTYAPVRVRKWLHIRDLTLEEIDNVPLSPLMKHISKTTKVLVIGLEPDEMTYRDNPKYQDLKIFPMNPKESLGFPLDFSHEHTKQGIDEGEKDAERWLKMLEENSTTRSVSMAEIGQQNQLRRKLAKYQEDLRCRQDAWQMRLEAEREWNRKLLSSSTCLPDYDDWRRDNPVGEVDTRQIPEMLLLPDDVVFSDRESEQQRLVNSITKLHQAMEQKIAAQKHEEVMPDSHLVRATHNQAQTDVNQQMNECLGELLKLQTFNELRVLEMFVYFCRLQDSMNFRELALLRDIGSDRAERLQLRLQLQRALPSASESIVVVTPEVSPLFAAGALDSPQLLLQTAKDAPENLVLFGTATLIQASRDSAVPDSVLAELLARCFLCQAADPKLVDVAKRHLTEDEWLDFLAWLPDDGQQALTLTAQEAAVQRLESLFAKPALRLAVGQRFRHLLGAAGVLPMYLPGDGDAPGRVFLIPFRLEPDATGVVDLNGQDIRNRRGYPACSDRLSRLSLPVRARLLCSGLDGLDWDTEAIALPLLMAWWRRQGGADGLPAFSPYALVAVGALTDERLLQPVVAVRELAAEVARQLPEATFAYPDNGEERFEPSLRRLPLSPCQPLDEVHRRLQECAERLADWDWRYLSQRLDALVAQVRTWNVTRWEVLQERLERASHISRVEHPQEYLLNLMLRSEASCHFGDTKAATQLNEKARQFAARHGDACRRQLLHLEIARLVLHQDNEDFAAVAAAAPDLEQRLAELADDDLTMRFHGTMGQAHAYGALAHVPGFSQQEARRHLDLAVEAAVRIGSDADIAQDLNYRCLYYALFEPEGEESDEAYEDASAKVRELQAQNAPAGDKNLLFLTHIRALGWYRVLLSGGQPHEVRLTSALRQLLRLENWLGATTAKYLAALDAALGRTDQARERFSQALNALTATSGILGLIRLTICAEAYRSLHDESFLSLGRELLSVPGALPAGPSLAVWTAYLRQPDTAPFPGLDYWY